MSLRTDAKMIAAIYDGMKGTLSCNHRLLDIYEGNLLYYIQESLKAQMSQRAYDSAKHRIPPINLLKRVVDKVSTIYSTKPERELTGTETDQEMYQWYMDNYQIDVQGQLANEYFSMHRAVAWEPYMDSEFMPRLRTLPYDRFFVVAANPSDPLEVTYFVKVMGVMSLEKQQGKNKAMVDKMILYCYSATEFLIIDEDGDPIDSMMAAMGADGVNNFGMIPFVYMNRSKIRVNPKPDTDMEAMTILVPVQLTDINYALMFQAFSIIYTVDVDSENMQLNPNVVWNLKSDATSDKKPEVGSIKPSLDSDKAMAAVQEQLGLWLQSRGIRPGATGQANTEMSLSGMSKMVDEMDATQERKKIIPFFQQAEYDLFDLIKYGLHPIYIRNPSFQYRAPFTADCELSVEFAEQTAVRTRKDILDEVVIELDKGLVSRESAMERLNPEMTDEQITEEMLQIETEKTITVNDIEVMNADEAPEVPTESDGLQS